MNHWHWPKTGSLLFVAREANQTLPYDFAKTVLCQEKVGNTNHNLALWDAGSHPDFKIIQPEDSRTIKIDQIRTLNEWAQEKPSIASTKVAIFHPADALNVQAANALLKTLEEPSLATLFILITAHPQRLLPTIRSRCHIIRYRTENHHSLNAELLQTNQIHKPNQPDKIGQTEQSELQQSVAQGLTELEQGKIGPIKLAESWSKKDVGQMLYWVVVYLNEIVKKSVMQGQVIRNRAWWAFFEHAMQAKQTVDDKSPANLNLLLEALLIRYARLDRE